MRENTNGTSLALYRKYRPKTFKEVLGQDHIVKVLESSIETNKVSHAYLFVGSRGTGKTSVARIFATNIGVSVNDLYEIDAASNRGIEDIKLLRDGTRVLPFDSKYKVYIIDEVHMLSKDAWGALLKTLEEPPAHAVFILATTEIHKVPTTIISRTQRFDFRSISQADILKLFETVLRDYEITISPEAQKLIAQAAGGSFRDALSILDQILAVGGKEITHEQVEDILGVTRMEVSQKLLDFVLQADGPSAAGLIKELAFAGKDLVQFSKNFLEYLRLVLLVKLGIENQDELGFAQEDKTKLSQQASMISGSKLLEIIKKVLEAHRETKQSPVQELPLLAAVLTLCPLKHPPEADFSLRPDFAKATTGKQGNPSLLRSYGIAKDSFGGQVGGQAVQTSEVPPSGVDLGVIVDGWAKVLARVKEYNHALLSSLRLGRLVTLENNELVLAFPYSFHKQTVDALKNKIVIEQVLEEIFNQKIRIKAFLEKDLEKAPDQAAGSDLMSEAIKILGE